MKKFFIIFFLLLLSNNFGQDKVMDSLLQVLENTSDSNKIITIQNKIIGLAPDSITEKKLIIRFCKNLDKKKSSVCQFRWGYYYYNRKQYDIAKKFYKRNEKLIQKSDSINHAQNYLNLLKISLKEENLDTIMYYLNKIKALNPPVEVLSKAYTITSKNLLKKFKLKEALDLLNDYTSIISKSDDKHYLGLLEYRKGQIYMDFKDFKNSLKYCLLAQENLDSAREPYIFAGNYYYTGLDYAALKEYETAIKYYDSAIVNYTKLHKIKTPLIIKNEKANALAYLNRHEEAMKLFQSVASKQKELGYNKNLAFTYSKMGISEYGQKNYSEAIKYFHKSLKLAKELKIYSLLRSNNYNLREVYYLTGKYKKAHDHLLLAFKYKDTILNNVKSTDLEELEKKYQTEKKDKEILQLKSQQAEKELALNQVRQEKILLGSGLGASVLFLGIFTFYYRRNQKQKQLIERLQRELHHRIKNNLATISALVNEIKKKHADNPELTQNLQDLNSRINSINEIHRQLYKEIDVSNLSMRKYVDKLSQIIQESFGNKNINIENLIDPEIKLQSDKSMLIGLLINEFITNSFKHAFTDHKTGKVLIKLYKNGKNYVLSMSDNGKGLPENFNLKKVRTFGMDVMQLFAEQLNGKFSLDGKNGMKVEIIFPEN